MMIRRDFSVCKTTYVASSFMRLTFRRVFIIHTPWLHTFNFKLNLSNVERQCLPIVIKRAENSSVHGGWKSLVFWMRKNDLERERDGGRELVWEDGGERESEWTREIDRTKISQKESNRVTEWHRDTKESRFISCVPMFSSTCKITIFLTMSIAIHKNSQSRCVSRTVVHYVYVWYAVTGAILLKVINSIQTVK